MFESARLKATSPGRTRARTPAHLHTRTCVHAQPSTFFSSPPAWRCACRRLRPLEPLPETGLPGLSLFIYVCYCVHLLMYTYIHIYIYVMLLFVYVDLIVLCKFIHCFLFPSFCQSVFLDLFRVLMLYAYNVIHVLCFLVLSIQLSIYVFFCVFF